MKTLISRVGRLHVLPGGLWATVLVACFIQAAAQPVFVKDSLDDYISREMKRWNIPGVAVAVVHDGNVVFSKGFGVRETGRKEKVNEETLFQIASCTKAFTGTAMAMLEDRLSLDERVANIFPSFSLYDPYPTGEVTIRDMLSHRIGFRTFQGDFLHWDCNLTREELMYNMKNIKPVYSFRSRYGYCNAGFLVAGQALQAVTDTTWDEFMKYRFFDPLNMKRTSTDHASIVNDRNAAKPYTVLDGRLIPLKYADINALAPAASINSCARDMASWIRMLLDSGRYGGSRIVPFEAIRKTWSSHTVVREPRDPTGEERHFYTYGLGWFLQDVKGRKVISHDGGANGFLTNTTLVPQERFGFFISTNTDANAFYDALREQLLDAITGTPYTNRSEAMYRRVQPYFQAQDSIRHALLGKAGGKSNDHAPQAYTGKYRNEVYGDIEVTSNGGRLVINFSRHPNLVGRLHPSGGDTFICSYSDVTYGVKEIPFEVAGDRAVAVTIKVNDFIDYMSYRFERTD